MNLQQELMSRIASEVLEESMFKTWHRVIFREIITLTQQQIPNVYAKFTEMACDYISDLLNSMCLLDATRMPLFIPASISPDDHYFFKTEHVKIVYNVAANAYNAADVDDVVQCLIDLQTTVPNNSSKNLTEFVPYRICQPTLVTDPTTFLPAMTLSVTYCYRESNFKFIHPDLV